MATVRGGAIVLYEVDTALGQVRAEEHTDRHIHL